MKCCLCYGKIEKNGNWEQKNNALPLKDGMCCDDCNEQKVIPERIRQHLKQMIKEQLEGK